MMAMPRPIRLLAGTSMVIFLFLLYTIVYNSPGTLKAPQTGGVKMDEMIRDPNLDGQFALW